MTTPSDAADMTVTCVVGAEGFDPTAGVALAAGPFGEGVLSVLRQTLRPITDSGPWTTDGPRLAAGTAPELQRCADLITRSSETTRDAAQRLRALSKRGTR
jgi:hypothetical protein